MIKKTKRYTLNDLTGFVEYANVEVRLFGLKIYEYKCFFVENPNI